MPFFLSTFYSLCIVLQPDTLTHALGDVYTMATYSQAVNVFGAVKTSKLGAVIDPVGQVAVWVGVVGVVGDERFLLNLKMVDSFFCAFGSQKG